MAQQVCSALMGLELADPEADIKARTPGGSAPARSAARKTLTRRIACRALRRCI
jgi:hypothetical protein